MISMPRRIYYYGRRLSTMPETPLKPLFDMGDALLAVAPHNLLLPLFSGGARPVVIHSPVERGAKSYLKGDFFMGSPLPGPA